MLRPDLPEAPPGAMSILRPFLDLDLRMSPVVSARSSGETMGATGTSKGGGGGGSGSFGGLGAMHMVRGGH